MYVDNLGSVINYQIGTHNNLPTSLNFRCFHSSRPFRIISNWRIIATVAHIYMNNSCSLACYHHSFVFSRGDNYTSANRIIRFVSIFYCFRYFTCFTSDLDRENYILNDINVINVINVIPIFSLYYQV